MKILRLIGLIFIIFITQGCLTYIFSGFSVVEKSKFIKPSWVDLEGFCTNSNLVSFVYKHPRSLDLPTGVKEAQERASINIQKLLPNEIKTKLRQIAETNGIKIYNINGLNRASFLQNSFSSSFTLWDLYYEKLASTDQEPDFYSIYVLMQLDKKNHSELCSNLIGALRKEKSSDLSKLAQILESVPTNCLE